jgi:hypothetical protein
VTKRYFLSLRVHSGAATPFSFERARQLVILKGQRWCYRYFLRMLNPIVIIVRTSVSLLVVPSYETIFYPRGVEDAGDCEKARASTTYQRLSGCMSALVTAGFSR